MPAPAALTIAVIGTGPAALMAAETLTAAGQRVTLYEKRRAAGRKLLIAGSSGLNIGNDLDEERFRAEFRGATPEYWRTLLERYPMRAWLEFIERELGLEIFLGTSGRWFVREMKAAGLLRRWLDRLAARGAEFRYAHECTGFETEADGAVRLEFGGEGSPARHAAALFALGGGSWEPDEEPLRWPSVFARQGLAFHPFVASNCGFRVQWPAGLLAEAEGQPLKRIAFGNARGSRRGELVITGYGLEGTPVYALGEPGPAWLDLKPDLTLEAIRSRCEAVRENLSPYRRIQRRLELGPAALAALFHLTDAATRGNLDALTAAVKRLPITLGERQPLREAISSSGGLAMSELDGCAMLRRFPGVFAAGEMLDWDAPTGGFLIHGSVAQGYAAARGVLDYLAARR